MRLMTYHSYVFCNCSIDSGTIMFQNQYAAMHPYHTADHKHQYQLVVKPDVLVIGRGILNVLLCCQ